MQGFLRHPLVVFTLRRLGYSAVVLFGVVVAVFALLQLVEGDPIRIALGTRYTEEAYQALRSASGLDRPLLEQFMGYVTGVPTGDLGVSFRTGQPVTAMLLDRLPASLSLGATAVVLALAIAVPAGTWAALREGRLADGIVRVTSQFGVSVPDFWMGVLLILTFSATLGWLPSSGHVPFSTDPMGWLRSIILPAATAALVAAAILTRYVRAAVLDVVWSGHLRTARSKGLSAMIILRRHILRNALLPILTITGIQMATIMSGLIVVEAVFAWPGLGRLVLDAVSSRDYPVIQGAILFIAALFLLINFLVDLLSAIIDPRIRVS